MVKMSEVEVCIPGAAKPAPRARARRGKRSAAIRGSKSKKETNDEADLQSLDARKTRVEEEPIPPAVLAKMVVTTEDEVDKAKAKSSATKKKPPAKGTQLAVVPPPADPPDNVTRMPAQADSLVDHLDNICDDQEVAFKFVLKQIAIEVDRLGELLRDPDKDLDPSLVSSRRVIALKNFQNLYERLQEHRVTQDGGASTVDKAMRLLFDCFKEASKTILTDDQYNLVLGEVRKMLGDHLGDAVG